MARLDFEIGTKTAQISVLVYGFFPKGGWLAVRSVFSATLALMDVESVGHRILPSILSPSNTPFLSHHHPTLRLHVTKSKRRLCQIPDPGQGRTKGNNIADDSTPAAMCSRPPTHPIPTAKGNVSEKKTCKKTETNPNAAAMPCCDYYAPFSRYPLTFLS
jgi:hypothetical protein